MVVLCMYERGLCVPHPGESARAWGAAGVRASTTRWSEYAPTAPSHSIFHPATYLESSSHAEDAVVGLLFGETGERKLDGLILLGDQVVGSAEVIVSILTHCAS